MIINYSSDTGVRSDAFATRPVAGITASPLSTARAYFIATPK